jgi:CheY-like chemotaxis protein
MGAALRLILYAEDDLDHAELVIRGLARAANPARVIHVRDGDALLDYLERSCGEDPAYPRPDLVLLDLRLPRRDGIEVLEQMRARIELAAIPVVILSTSNADRDIARAYRCHVNSYVVKPTEFAVLTRFVQDLTTYWTTWNVTPT